MEIKIIRISKSSWFKIIARDKVIYFDPGYTGYFENNEIPVAELNNDADLVLISHFHKDHLQPEALRRIVNKQTRILAPFSCQDRIVNPFTIVRPGDELSFGEIKVKVVNAYNTPEGHSTRKVHHKGDFVGYVVEVAGIRIYHAGDTDVIPEMQTLGKLDIALLPISGIFVMDVDEAVEAVTIIKPGCVIPMHQGKQDMLEFKTKAADTTPDTTVSILNCGDSIKLS